MIIVPHIGSGVCFHRPELVGRGMMVDLWFSSLSSTVSVQMFLGFVVGPLSFWDRRPTGFPCDASIGVRESGHSKCVYFGLQFSLAPRGHLEQTHREVLKFS